MTRSVLICTPTYSGQVAVEYVGSVLGAAADLTAHGIVPHFDFHPGLCYVALARCMQAKRFLEGPCDDLLFWDDDVGAPAAAVRSLLVHDVEVVAGVYPRKVGHDGQSENFPWLSAGRRNGPLIEAEGLPTGFMRIRRDVIERMVAAYPERLLIDPITKEQCHNLFPCEVVDNVWWGEDYRFCQLARAIGIKLWVDPDIDFRHVGRNTWHGNLRKQINKERGLPAGLESLTVAPIEGELEYGRR